MAQENITKKEEEDALELAYLMYDIYKESQINQKSNGQDNADQIETTN